MPIFKTHGKLIYYAHVPKCGGSAVAAYLRDRCGPVAFHNNAYLKTPERDRWTRSSPQHVDREALGLLFPPGFFDAAFTIVRHPVARLISAYHFQLEVEKTVPAGTGFSAWLDHIEAAEARDPFVFDNHTRPMDAIVPEGAEVFRLEDGIDALIPWLDSVTGTAEGPREIPKVNERGAYAKGGGEKARPTEADLARIETRYAADFTRFGYDLAAPARTPTTKPRSLLTRLGLSR